MDTLANSLNSLKIAEKMKKKNTAIKPASKLLGAVLNIFKEEGYIQGFDAKPESNEYVVSLKGSINECGAIKPRFAVKKDAWERYELRYLPAREIGTLVVATSQGLMPHEKAKEKGLGGRLICFIY
ncbi:30S ribosomal protein S8 [Candidatus Micrarchaeota archaeon]|nr:30S ribosomal protein S8 [Candidatus Micrarchaeota archaeon]